MEIFGGHQSRIARAESRRKARSYSRSELWELYPSLRRATSTVKGLGPIPPEYCQRSKVRVETKFALHMQHERGTASGLALALAGDGDLENCAT